MRKFLSIIMLCVVVGATTKPIIANAVENVDIPQQVNESNTGVEASEKETREGSYHDELYGEDVQLYGADFAKLFYYAGTASNNGDGTITLADGTDDGSMTSLMKIQPNEDFAVVFDISVNKGTGGQQIQLR